MGLKGIPDIISPDLLHVLASMGHGDELVLADTHFPTASVCKDGAKQIRADGLPIPELLEAILNLIPLDAYTYAPVRLMEVAQVDKRTVETPIWNTYKEIFQRTQEREIPVEEVERFQFYEYAKSAFAVVHTGEKALYANLILRKGVIEK